MLADYHIHTKMCGHAVGEMEEYVRQAQKEGLAEIGISDHIPMYFWPEPERDPSIAMSENELPTYVQAVRGLQEQFHPYPIRLGIEADFSAEYQKELKEIITRYPFDYVLGSIHFIDKWGFDNPAYIEEYKNRDIDQVFEQYFGLLEKAAQSKQFDVLAHPDLVKKLGFLPTKDLNYIYQRLARIFAQMDICIEVNTAGLRAPVKEIFPAAGFLKWCFESKVPVTLGSDAHCPEQVGYGFAQAKALLQEIGYKKITVFSQRKRRYITL